MKDRWLWATDLASFLFPLPSLHLSSEGSVSRPAPNSHPSFEEPSLRALCCCGPSWRVRGRAGIRAGRFQGDGRRKNPDGDRAGK